MFRRLVAALVVLGLIAHAQLFATHQAMALEAALAGEGSPSWLCLSQNNDAVSPEALRALEALRQALGEQPQDPKPQEFMTGCAVCLGLATACLLPAIATIAVALPRAIPAPAPLADAIAALQPDLLPPGCGPPSPTV